MFFDSRTLTPAICQRNFPPVARLSMRWVFSVWSLAIISVSAQSNAQAPAFGTCKPISEGTGEVGCWILAPIRHGDRAALAHAFVTFALKPAGTIEQMKMAAVSRLAH